jgi:hypothetical protein
MSPGEHIITAAWTSITGNLRGQVHFFSCNPRVNAPAPLDRHRSSHGRQTGAYGRLLERPIRTHEDGYLPNLCPSRISPSSAADHLPRASTTAIH